MKVFGTTDWLAEEVKELKNLKDKLSTKGTTYLFVIDDYSGNGPDTHIEEGCPTFKDSLVSAFVYYNGKNDMFCKGIRGFGDDDLDGMMEFFNHFSDSKIQQVYILGGVVWDCNKVEYEE